MIRARNYKPSNLVLMNGLLSEGHSLHLLKNKPYDRLTEYLIDLSKTYEDAGIPTFKKIKEHLRNVNFNKWLPLMIEDLFYLNSNHPTLFQQSPTAARINFNVSFKYKANSIMPEAYTIWNTGQLSLHDTVYLPILETVVPNRFFEVTHIIKSFNDGNMETDVSLTGHRGGRYQAWLIQRALFENKVTENELILDPYGIDKKLKRWYT